MSGCTPVCAGMGGFVQACAGVHEYARVYARMCTRVCAGMCEYVRVGAGVAGVSGFSNNYELSEYLLETIVFMQWPLIRILFEFFVMFSYFSFW